MNLKRYPFLVWLTFVVIAATGSQHAFAVTAGQDASSGVVAPSADPGSGQLNFQADIFSGRFGYTVPIVVAPARQGAEPKLALTYSSGGGNGWCGVGWGLEVGYI